MLKSNVPVFVMNIKPTMDDGSNPEDPEMHIQRREKELKVTSVLKPKFNQNLVNSKTKSRTNSYYSNESNSDLKYFNKNVVEMSKSSNESGCKDNSRGGLGQRKGSDMSF